MPITSSHLQAFNIRVPTETEIPIGVGIAAPITAPIFAAILAGKKKLIVFGKVAYRDQFQWWGTRFTHFCFELDPTPKPSEAPGSYGFVINASGWNDAD